MWRSIVSKRLGEVLVVAVLVAGTAWLGQLVYHNRVVHADAPGLGTEIGIAPVVLPVSDAAGQHEDLALAGRERPLLLLVMRTTCPYCEENMPNWGELLDRLGAADSAGMEAMVLSLSSPRETDAYLAGHAIDVPVRYVDTAVLDLLGVTGVPTTVVVEPTSRRLSVWEGILTEGERRAVLAWGATLPASASGPGPEGASGSPAGP